MVGWMAKKNEKIWMVGWIKKMKKKQMDGWMDGQKKIYEKQMDGWMDKKID